MDQKGNVQVNKIKKIRILLKTVTLTLNTAPKHEQNTFNCIPRLPTRKGAIFLLTYPEEAYVS